MTETNYRSDSLPSGTADRLNDRSPNLTAEELEIIGYFVRGQKHSLASQGLKLEYTETSIRLSDRECKLLGISKQVNQWQRKVLISNKSVYRFAVIDALIELGFITKQKSSHPEFTEYHYYTILDGYKLNYTEAIQLWRVWWNSKRYQLNSSTSPIDVLTFSRGNWYLVRDLQPKQGDFILRTDRGEITVEPKECLVWIDRIELKQQDSSSNSSPQLNSHLLSEGKMPLEVHSLPVHPVAKFERSIEHVPPHHFSQRDYIQELPKLEEDIDLESYLNTFNTQDSEHVDRIEGIYDISELLGGKHIVDDVSALRSPKSTNLPTQPAPVMIDSVPIAPSPVEAPTPQPPLSVLQRQESLKLKAMNVLANYLQEGDLIVHTEILKNDQGEEINRKVTKTQRGCPSWAIDLVQQIT
jgi:hypothetical protein